MANIIFACACGQQMQTDDRFAGMQAKCPRCGQPVTVPGEYYL